MSLLVKLWARRRDRPVFVGVALFVLSALAAYPLVDLWLRTSFEFASTFDFHDFGAYTQAVGDWQAGETFYQRTDEGGFWGSYLYPPIVLLLFFPFVELFEFRAAAMGWIATSGLLLWLGLQALIAALGYKLRWYERLGLAWIIAGFHPVLLTAKMGQTALFMGALLSFAGAALVWGQDDPDSKWALVSGACTAVVGIVKFAYAPVGAHLLHDRRRLLGALLVVPPVAVLSLWLFGVEAHRTYAEVLQWGFEKGGEEPRSPTLWLPPYFKPLAWFPAPQALRVLASLVVAGLAMAAPRRAGHLVFALGVITFPLFTTQTYAYYLVALLPAVVVLFAEEVERDGYPELVLLGLLCAHFHSYGLRFFVKNMPDNFDRWANVFEGHYFLLQPGLWGCAILFGLALVRVAGTVDAFALTLRERTGIDLRDSSD
jgi:alpha-1,2-mannosyltransferase